MQGPFQKVADVVRLSPEVVLQEEGIEHKKQGRTYQLRGEWTDGFLCFVGCGDTSGSASVTRELFFHCHQCNTKLDLFDWLARRHGTDAWVECKRLAERFNVSLVVKRPSGRNMPKRMTADVLDASIHELLEADVAQQARTFLKERKLFAPRALAELGIGYIKGYLVFPQFSVKGDLLERYRAYLPGGEPPWRWFGVGSGGPGVWPAQRAPAEGDKILLLEGEWDVLTALVRVRFHRQGWTPVTFTSGAGSHPPAVTIPRWFTGREVHVAYDNDTFQGIDYANYRAVAKPGRKLDNAIAAMQARLVNVIDRIVPMLEELGATPVMRQCPIDPSDVWGADFRDWVERGGRDFGEWPEFRSPPPVRSGIEDVTFDETFAKIGSRVRTVVQVNTLSEDDVIIPQQVSLDCPMGQAPACSQCPAVRLFPDRVISLQDYPELAARSLLPHAERNAIVKTVVKPPRGCPGATISMRHSVTGSIWTAIRPSTTVTDDGNRTMFVISDDPPSLTGNVELTGTVYSDPDASRAFIRAEKVRSIDRTEVDLRPHLRDFMGACPHAATRVQELDDFLTERWRDLTANVTRIYGRRELTIAHDLLMHSASEMRLQRESGQRGWLDICVFGNTRSGKTATFDALFHHHGLGLIHSAVSNVSRAGIVMGTDTKGQLRPGLFPRCHRKALVLDEWHLLVRNSKNGGHPGSWIQTARDSGWADSAKISGNRKLPSRVRFASIANWSHGSRRHHQFDCQHLVDYYDTPEAIARLDFAIAVGDDPTQTTIDPHGQFWTAERTRIMVMRAWMMTVDQVHFEAGAIDVAQEAVREWQGLYETEAIPLFTVEEKALSIMRVAASVANVTFSHPDGKPEECLVRPVHVRWAIDWIRWTWDQNGYTAWSEAEARREELTNVFMAERLLTVGLQLDDFGPVGNVLGDFFSGFTVNDLNALTGKESMDATRWLSQARRFNIFKLARGMQTERQKRYVPTRGGVRLLQAIIRTADDDPQHYVERYRALANWFATAPDSRSQPVGLTAIGGRADGDVPF